MSSQPIKKTIKETYGEIVEPPIYTLIIDGTNLLKISMVDTKVNTRGEHIGGIFQFLLQLKLMLKKKDWDYVYVVWDGEESGILRFIHYPEYKANRDKNYNTSEYDKAINDYVKMVLSNSKKKTKSDEELNKKEEDKESFDRQKLTLMKFLEELFIRQLTFDKCEGDDLIAYYTINKKPNEKVVIMSSDRDLTQLIKDDVCVYIPPKKAFITPQNHKEIMGYIHENVLLKKILIGDTSDNIKGIKGLGEKTLYDNFPDIKTKKLTLDDIISSAKTINENRKKEKKKPLQVCENIINKQTDGSQGVKIYEINKKIIDLSNPLLTEEAICDIDNYMYNVIDPDGRSFENVYKYIIEADITDLLSTNNFSSFFSDFKRIVLKESDRFKKPQM